ncbi:MAG: DUF2207 domain-containing protein [Oscillospiraceae bacterium]|nr:DUF2207 domain-containing protein [Oscillospiraceae bacterium]
MKISKFLKIFIIIFSFSIIFLISNKVNANSIDSINMDISINTNGNAHVTETWNCNATQGTELYHPYYNIGNSNISNLTVTNGNTQYTTLSSWNVNASFSAKQNKCGINYVSNGVELCWGISSYGTHSYVVSYDISNFVSELTDSQMAYWTLIPSDLSNDVGSVDIKIHSDIYFPQTIDVWGFGQYGAPCYVQNGYIEMKSNGTLTSSEYMTILAKFPLGTFTLSNKLNNDFQYYLGMAEQGATNYTNTSSSQGYFTNNIVSDLFYILMVVVIFIVSIFVRKNSTSSSLTLDFGKAGKRLPSDVPYFRDIPCKGDIFRAYFIAYNYNLMKNKADFLGAILLKWLKDGKIKVEKRTVGKILHKQETCIILDSSSTFDMPSENELHLNLYEASGDGVLEPNEFKKWCIVNYTKVSKWFDDILIYERDRLVTENTITETESGIFKFKKYVVDSSLKNEAIELKGLKNYLKNYTLIKDREAIEVTLLEEYLMLAQMFGIAKEVSKEFEKLYPKIIEENNYNFNYADVLFISSFAYIASAAQIASYAGGGGGFSAGGGGFGSFGGRWRWPADLDRKIF